MDYANKVIAEKFGHPPVKTYYAWQFEQMIEETKPDIVIVTSIDRTHDRYIIAAMNLGCDVITEKPMTIDEVRCQNILDTVKATGRELRVTLTPLRSTTPRSGSLLWMTSSEMSIRSTLNGC